MTIYLLDGRVIDSNQVTLNESSQKFYLKSSGEDLTRLLKQADKRTFSGFDIEASNEMYYREAHPNAPEVGSTSVTGNFIHQILNDPLEAPADALASGVDSVKTFATSGKGLLVAGVIILGLLIWLTPRR